MPWSGPFVDPEREADGSAEGGGYGRIRGDEAGRSTVAGSLVRKGATGREEEGLSWRPVGEEKSEGGGVFGRFFVRKKK